MEPFDDASVQPTVITAEGSDKTLVVEWADGHVSRYSWEWLRWRCPCAECQGEMGIPGKLQTTEKLQEEQKELVNLSLVGSYGIQLQWADGHSYGIYSFSWMRRACPCDECGEKGGKSSKE